MSAYVVSKKHVDLLVRAAIHYGKNGGGGSRMQWWEVDESGDYAGWRYLDEHADGTDPQRVTASQLGQLLVSENVRSVSYRYSEPGRVYYYGAEEASSMDDLDADAGELPGPSDPYYAGPYVYSDPGRVLSPGAVFKAIDGLDYQSCEHDGWRASEAFAFLESLRQVVCRAVDGYEAAPWALDS